MQARTLPSMRGWSWIGDGFGIFRANPLMFSLLVLGYFLAALLISSLPLLGPPLLAIILTLMNVGIMNACRGQARGVSPKLTTLFSAFQPLQQSSMRHLLLLGISYFLYSIFALELTSLLFGEALIVSRSTETSSAASQLNTLRINLPAILCLSALMLPAILAWWFAPVLVAWHGQSSGKALFFSLIACVRNWRAFLLYAFSLFAWGILIPTTLISILQNAFPDAAQLVSAVALALLLPVLMPTLFASYYISYRDIFERTDHAVHHGEATRI